ncbi:MAG: transglycosylase SLT domain-containing protein [Wenzhouxiangellaceae bacterium]
MRTLLIPMLLLAGGLAFAQPADPWTEQRAVFVEAWQAAARGRSEALSEALLRIPDYPLAPYLRYEWIRQRLDQVDPDEVARFIADHRDWSFADPLEQAWLDRLARSGRTEALLRYGQAARRAATRCVLERARLEAGDTDGLEQRVRELWLAPQSQPSACDPLFAWWRARGNPDVDTAWQRLGLAIEAGQTPLARYLLRYLPQTERFLAEGWIEMQRRPASALAAARHWPDRERARRIVAWGLARLAASDWARAAELEAGLRGHFSFHAEEIDAARRRIALFRAVDLDPGAIETIDAIADAGTHPQLLEWRARVALATGRWDQVLETIHRMPENLYSEHRWRYWRARALEALGRAGDAALVYRNLALESDYWSFLASVRSGRPLALCNRELKPDAVVQRALYRMPAFVRALELKRAGLDWHARWTWMRHVQPLPPESLEQAALVAASIGWHDRAIAALGAAGARDAYLWRFPVVERERVLETAARYGIDPALVFGIMRAESAMQADARSSADARGLLQLIPPTARAVARRNGLAYSGPADLYLPEQNIVLGIAHLAELAERFSGDPIRIIAAYNAGSRHVDRWDEKRATLPPDVWIETLSFHETRSYVPSVLAFATIYEWQLDRTPALLARAMRVDRATHLAFACPPGRPDPG